MAEGRGVYLPPSLLAPFAIGEGLLSRELNAPQLLGLSSGHVLALRRADPMPKV